MNLYRADLHIHTVLSPCGTLEMSPVRIVERAKEQRLDIIAITDHNSTLHGPVVRRLAEPMGIKVLFGAEANTREEVHCLCLFETEEQRLAFQEFLDTKITRIPNDVQRFGEQVVVNEAEEILYEVDHFLHAALAAGIDEVEQLVHQLGGIFIPAHVDRPMFSLVSQLGIIPSDLRFDALELSKNTSVDHFLQEHPYLKVPCFIRNSDAHWPEQIGTLSSTFCMENDSLDEIRKCLHQKQNREVVL